jgi:hypothetical protein
MPNLISDERRVVVRNAMRGISSMTTSVPWREWAEVASNRVGDNSERVAKVWTTQLV